MEEANAYEISMPSTSGFLHYMKETTSVEIYTVVSMPSISGFPHYYDPWKDEFEEQMESINALYIGLSSLLEKNVSRDIRELSINALYIGLSSLRSTGFYNEVYMFRVSMPSISGFPHYSLGRKLLTNSTVVVRKYQCPLYRAFLITFIRICKVRI